MTAASLFAARLAKELTDAIARHAVGDDALYYRIQRECLAEIPRAPPEQQVVLFVGAYIAEILGHKHDGRGGFPQTELTYWTEGAEILVGVLKIVGTSGDALVQGLSKFIAAMHAWEDLEPRQ